MTEAVLQILLLLAYLAIGLISITFPIYAICVAYLKQEKWETTKERKKRIKKLEDNIARLTKELSGEKKDSERFTQIREQLEKCESESRSLELRVEHLTAKGAVGRPVQYLVIALASVSAGIYCFYEGYKEAVAFFGLVSGLFSTLTIYNLYTTVSAVEYAVLRPARTIEFNVAYTKGEKTKRVRVGKETRLQIFTGTTEDDVEKCVMYVIVPSELGIPETSLSKSVYSDYTIITTTRDFLPKNFAFGSGFSIVPKKVGKYSINVTVCARGIYENKKKLSVDVVK